jgi:hypothetical protein
MFESFDEDAQVLIFQALKTFINSGGGTGFHNNDRGHPTYRLGAQGTDPGPGFSADSADRNQLYRMLGELSQSLKEKYSGFVWWYDFTEWRDFCRFALDAWDAQSPWNTVEIWHRPGTIEPYIVSHNGDWYIVPQPPDGWDARIAFDGQREGLQRMDPQIERAEIRRLGIPV